MNYGESSSAVIVREIENWGGWYKYSCDSLCVSTDFYENFNHLPKGKNLFSIFIVFHNICNYPTERLFEFRHTIDNIKRQI